MSMTVVISGFVTPKEKTKSKRLAGQNVRNFSKSVVKFSSFPVSLSVGEVYTPNKLPVSKHGRKMISCNKSAN